MATHTFRLDRHDSAPMYTNRDTYVAAFDSIEGTLADFAKQVKDTMSRADLSAVGATMRLAKPEQDTVDAVAAKLKTIADLIAGDQAAIDAVLAETVPPQALDVLLERQYRLAILLRQYDGATVDKLLRALNESISADRPIDAEILVDLAKGALETSGLDGVTRMLLTDNLTELTRQALMMRLPDSRRAALEHQDVVHAASDKAELVANNHGGRIALIKSSQGDDPAAGFFGFDMPLPANFQRGGHSHYGQMALASGARLFYAGN